MEDLGKKVLKGIKNPFKTKFKGQGQKLGGTEDVMEDGSKAKAPGGVGRTGPAAARTLLNQRLQQEDLLKRQEQERRELQRQRWAQDKGTGPSSQGSPFQPGSSPQQTVLTPTQQTPATAPTNVSPKPQDQAQTPQNLAQTPPNPSRTASNPAQTPLNSSQTRQNPSQTPQNPSQSPPTPSETPLPATHPPVSSTQSVPGLSSSDTNSLSPSKTAPKVEPPPTDFDPFKPFMGSGRALEARGAVEGESSHMDVDSPKRGDDLQVAVGLLVSDPSSRPAVEVLSKLFGNVVANPGNEKFRKVRLTNPKIAETVGRAAGGVGLLRAVGFQIQESDGANGSKDQWAVLGGASKKVIERVSVGLELLERGLASQPLYITPGSLVKSPEVLEQERLAAEAKRAQREREREPEVVKAPDRLLKVFLPASENAAARIDVPDSFFKLTPSEVRAEAAARKKALENSQLLIPRSFREKQARQARENCAAAMIRIQFPDGMVLQGVFAPLEPTSAIYEFVAGALKNPAQTFHLVYSYPTKNPIIPATPPTPGARVPTILDADLVPSGLLKFRGHDDDTTPFAGLQNELLLTASSL